MCGDTRAGVERPACEGGEKALVVQQRSYRGWKSSSHRQFATTCLINSPQLLPESPECLWERNLELHLGANGVRKGSVGRQTGTWEPLRLPMEAKEYVRLFWEVGQLLVNHCRALKITIVVTLPWWILIPFLAPRQQCL